MITLKFLDKENTGKMDESLRGWHIDHPTLPDTTLCGNGIEDNNEGYEILKSSIDKITCKNCKEIIKFCKRIQY